jgi:hypothetical protein
MFSMIFISCHLSLLGANETSYDSALTWIQEQAYNTGIFVYFM